MYIYIDMKKCLRNFLFFLSIQCSGCSVVGYDNSGNSRYVLVNKMLASITSIMHALFHILGRYHEHQRTDRDSYVSVKKENIMKGIVPTYCSCKHTFPCLDGLIIKLNVYIHVTSFWNVTKIIFFVFSGHFCKYFDQLTVGKLFSCKFSSISWFIHEEQRHTLHLWVLFGHYLLMTSIIKVQYTMLFELVGFIVSLQCSTQKLIIHM